LQEEVSLPGFWDASSVAQGKMKVLSSLVDQVTEWRNIQSHIDSSLELFDLALLDRDREVLNSISEEMLDIKEKLDELEFKLTLSGEYDRRDAILALHAGAGGVDSQDWVSILMRMYIRWCERRGFKSEVLDISNGEEAGIKSAIVQVTGEYAYGYMKAEKGVHRLVRLSPFDNDHARHTSFALAEVMPRVDEGVDIKIDSDDIRMDVFRAGGHGGQNVQKNSTAVRLTHLPSGIVVSCQNERSQHQNREIALRILTARLIEQEQRKKDAEMAEIKGDHVSAEWGNQIRSYVLHPYQMVKDHRTDKETSNTSAVLDGDIDGFMTAYLTSTI